MGLFFSLISFLCAVVGLPILCILEYYSGMKMGMYRYFVLKNSWWLKNVFTFETLPIFLIISSLITAAGIYLLFRRSKIFLVLYGAIIFCVNFYILWPENFMKLNTAPFFALICLAATVFYFLGSLTYYNKQKNNFSPEA